MALDLLPDSRLHDPKGSFMADWQLPGGKTVRIEVENVYCANCGKLYGYVPKENTTSATFLCRKCFESWGAIAGTYVEPEEEFNQRVQFEMLERFHHYLTFEELVAVIERGELGRPLELLLRESPYPGA